MIQRELPEGVVRALELATRLGVQNSCIPDVGRLLRVLVAGTGAGTVAELGTGCGVGAAWMLSGLKEDQRFLSVEADLTRHQAVTVLFAGVPNARFVRGDWRDILSDAPFRLVFVDVGEAKDEGAEEVVQALAVGGMALLDDFTPVEHWPPEWRDKPDARRAFWLNHPRLFATEVRTTARTAAILAVRVS